MTRRLLRYLSRLQSQLWIWLLALSATVIVGIGTLVRGMSFGLLVFVAVAGLALGWLLARLRVPGWLALPVLIGAGLEVVLLAVGRLLPLLLALVGVLGEYPIALLSWSRTGPPSLLPLWAAAEALRQGSGVVLARLAQWLGSLGEAGAYDPLPAQLIWSWVLWFAAGLVAYLIWRGRQALLAVAPLGALLAVTTFFADEAFSLLGAFLLLALALQAGTGWARRERRWQTSGLDYASDLALDLFFAVVPLIFLIVSLSVVTPQISVSRLAEFVQRRLFRNDEQIGNVASSFGLERRAPSIPPSIPGGLPRSHLLGSGPELSEQVVMAIMTDDAPAAWPHEFGGDPPQAHYWLSATFDTYTGHGWISSPTALADLAAGASQLSPLGPGRELRQTVRRIAPRTSLLYTAGFPLEVDQPSQIVFRSDGDWVGTLLDGGETYTARSWLPEATPDDLRAAGTDYPPSIAERYLKLPADLPERVRRLALDLTATESTPYDRALALETYLRGIPYSLDLPEPPFNQDVADYFLFDLRAGYCDYYATAMVVLARAAGLPARFVIGYAPSPYNYETAQYVVRESEAHSWTQIYFPGHGWIDFEPTGGRAPLSRPAGDEVAGLPSLPPGFEIAGSGTAPAVTPRRAIPWWAVLLAGLAGLILSGGAALWGDARRLAYLPPERLVPLLEGRLERSAERLRVPLPPGSTPLEFERRLLDRLAVLAGRRPLLQRLGPSPADVTRLIGAYILVRYAPHPAANLDRAACLAAWRRLRWRLWAAVLLSRFGPGQP